MLLHNPECTNGGAHAYTACRDRFNQPLRMIEVPDPVVEAPQASNPVVLGSQLTPEEQETLAAALKAAETIAQAEPALEAAARAFGGLVHPVAVQTLAKADQEPSAPVE